jgi:hypothetical protein
MTEPETLDAMIARGREYVNLGGVSGMRGIIFTGMPGWEPLCGEGCLLKHTGGWAANARH